MLFCRVHGGLARICRATYGWHCLYCGSHVEHHYCEGAPEVDHA